jgi:hypothetical protein
VPKAQEAFDERGVLLGDELRTRLNEIVEELATEAEPSYAAA